MAIRAICVALSLLSLSIAGCGTCSNLVKTPPEQGGKTPFGGVRKDLALLDQAAHGSLDSGAPAGVPAAEQHPQILQCLFLAADLPFTLFGDVVTWPYAAIYSTINEPVPVPPILPAPTLPSMPPPTPPLMSVPTEDPPRSMPLPTLPPPRPLP